MLIRIAEEFPISEITAEQTELPHVIGNVFADVADGAVGADDDFLIFLGNRFARCSLGLSAVSGFVPVPARRITQQPLFFPSFS